MDKMPREMKCVVGDDLCRCMCIKKYGSTFTWVAISNVLIRILISTVTVSWNSCVSQESHQQFSARCRRNKLSPNVNTYQSYVRS
mmetsp:Transcript_53166/g.112990  ORF Transcript_53166/g.112990 Transcript_53166/m.112990 type:complete len:85 (+) Transcript_53166:764-1018(+)